MAAIGRNLKLDVPSVRTTRSDESPLPHFVRRGTPFDECISLEENGWGAFSTVYQIENRDGTFKAIKVLDAGPYKTAKIRKALNEAEIGMKVDHPNILPIDEVWYDGTRFFFIMDLVTPLSESSLPESLKEKIGLFQQLVSAVAHLYSQGILHRDIKLANTGVKLGEDGKLNLFLFDFGESCKTSDNCYECVGTILNISPEVLDHSKYSDRSEVWALVCYLIELLTGKSMILGLFDGSLDSITAIHVQLKIDSLTEPPIPEVFKTDKSQSGLILLQILKRGLAIDPKTRLTFLELQAFLQQLLELL
jgi:serine/threonine protein kinase